MALILLQVLVLGVTAAAVDDVPIIWSQGGRGASLPCAVADWSRVQPRRPPPPLDDERPRAKAYFWRRGDEEINPKRISSNGTLEVTRKAGGGGDGVYQCGVRHHGGIVLGYPVHLKFSYMDKQFTSQPRDVAAPAGQPLAIPCHIGSGPPATVTWLKNGKGLPEDDRYFVLQSALLILDVRIGDEGSYRCTVTNAYVNKTRSSHEGRVSVVEPADEEPSFVEVQHVDEVTAERGSRIVLPCPMHGWPRPKLIWEQTPPGERTGELESTDEVLVLPSLEYDQEGVFTCAVEGHSELSKSFNVTVTEPVRLVLPPKSKEAIRASTVRFNCTAAGRPEPRVAWYKDGRPLALTGRINVRMSADRTFKQLVIGGVMSNDAGVYQCFATGAGGSVSGWAQLAVTGAGAAPPAGVWCAPTGDRAVQLSWAPADDVMAYTVFSAPTDKPGPVVTGTPINSTVDVVKLDKSLTPYQFQVRAYVKSGASDMSHSVVCQGQGVPIKLTKSGEDKIVVSWKSFVEETPGVVVWMLQYRPESELAGGGENVTLPADVTSYTLPVSSAEPLLVRLLGSRTPEWLPQNLTLVPWTSSSRADDVDDGEVAASIEELEATSVRARSLSLRWRCVRCPARHSFRLCVRAPPAALEPHQCSDSVKPSATIEGLLPDTQYEVRVQARAPGRAAFPPAPPYHVTTRPEGPQRLKDLTYKFVNASTLMVSWTGAPSNYTVHYSAQLKLPVEQWAALTTTGNSVLINGVQPSEQTFVMVTGHEPRGHSPILTVPPQLKDLELYYEYTRGGVRVRWAGAGAGAGARVRLVRYSQNITRPLESWAARNVSGTETELEGLEWSLPLYVLVSDADPGQKPTVPPQVLTVPPRPAHDNFYTGVVVGCIVGVLLLLVAAAVCVWRRRKKAQTSGRSRRSHDAAAARADEEGAEMKVVGARLCNGAGEPLLNGHVHITENPASKTPNGRMKKPRRLDGQFEAFDVSRSEANTTLETTLDESYGAFDTSRPPDPPASRGKLPDDNMNLETGRFRDDSQIQPTLQPNG